jgi:hypothetical protein
LRDAEKAAQIKIDNERKNQRVRNTERKIKGSDERERKRERDIQR